MRPSGSTPMLVLALLSSSCVVAWDNWSQEPNFVQYESREPLQAGDKVFDAHIELNVGKLEVEAGETGSLYDLEVHYDSNGFEPELDFQRQGETARLDFKLRGRNRGTRRIEKTRLTLRPNPQTRLRLRAETGVTESEIDFTGLPLESLRLEAGVGGTRLAMLAPNTASCEEIRISNGVGALEATGLGNFGFRKLVFEGGVGGAELDFSGAWEREAEVRIGVGVGGVHLRFPRDLGIELETVQSIFSSIDLRDFEKRGGRYRSRNFEEAAKTVRVSIAGGIGSVEIDWM